MVFKDRTTQKIQHTVATLKDFGTDDKKLLEHYLKGPKSFEKMGKVKAREFYPFFLRLLSQIKDLQQKHIKVERGLDVNEETY